MADSNDNLQRIERAVHYMATRLSEESPPDLEAIASHVGLSKYHFHRLYSLVTGETCQDTLTRLRLAKGARALENPKATVTDAAFDAGYGSSQAFAKAFRRRVRATASSLRAEPERLAQTVLELTEPPQAAGERNPALRVELASFDPFSILAIRTEGTYPKLNVVYAALFEAVGDPTLVAAIIGRPHQDITGEGGAPLRFDCGLKLTRDPVQLPAGMERQQVSGGHALLTRHLGDYDGLPQAVDRLYLSALADPDIRLAHAPLLFHYLDDPEETSAQSLRTDIYLPLDTSHLELTS